MERGELIARTDHTAPKHSCSYVKEDDYSLVNLNKQFFVQLACMFMVIGNVIKSVTSLNVLNLKRVIGLATLECVGWERCVIAGSLATVQPYGFGAETFICIWFIELDHLCFLDTLFWKIHI